MCPTPGTSPRRKGRDLYAIEWPFLALDYDRERAQGRVRNRLAPLLRGRAGFWGLLVLVRGGIESTRHDRQTGKSLRFDCCQVRCLALWGDRAGMLRAEDELSGLFREELGRAVLEPERRVRYEVVYRALPREPGAETNFYGTVTAANVRLEDLEEAIGRTVGTVAPALAGKPGCEGVLILRDYDAPTAHQRDRGTSGVDLEPALPGAQPNVRRHVRAYQHWCVSLWETQRYMEDANELASWSVVEELSDLIPRGWRVDRTNYEGTFFP